MTKCYDITPAPWFDNHENLYKLAEWLREHRGWEFCKNNLLDVLETPWSWENEWRLASGDVEFVLVPFEEHDTEEFTNDGTSCVWCDAQVGYVTDIDGGDTPWVTTYRDGRSGDLACDTCAGTAANFTETTPVSTEFHPGIRATHLAIVRGAQS